MPSCKAHNSTACVTGTAAAVSLKLVLVAFGGTMMLPGTVTAELLLTRLTSTLLLPAGAVNVTVQLSLSDPVSDELLQEMPLSTLCGVAGAAGSTPRPLRLITGSPPAVTLPITVTSPDTSPALAGVNST